jgi:hypothetical protein
MGVESSAHRVDGHGVAGEVSSQNVTGPSLTSETCMFAPNIPAETRG